MNKIVIEGKTLRLRVARPEDLDYIMLSEADDENAGFIISDSREFHFATLDSDTAKHFIVEIKYTGAPVGFLMTMGLDSPHRDQEWRRIVINEKGMGYGKETMKLIFEWAFEIAGAHRVWLDCKDYNARALHVYESSGMKREAFLREAVFANGKYENLIVLALLDWEWRAMKKQKESFL